MPKFSVIITSYNYSEYISETIKSVLAQTYSDWELIIVDDCSSDNSVEIIKSFMSDDRIKLICHNENKGLKAATKTALEQVQGEWAAFLESDDLWFENTLEKRLEVINQYDNVDFVFNDVEFFGNKLCLSKLRDVLNERKNKLKNKTFQTNIFEDLCASNLMLTFSAVTIKVEKLKSATLETPVDRCFDWWLFIQLAYDCSIYYINEPLTKWRLHQSSYINAHKKLVNKLMRINTSAYFNVFLYKHSLRALICMFYTIVANFNRFCLKLLNFIMRYLIFIYYEFKIYKINKLVHLFKKKHKKNNKKVIYKVLTDNYDEQFIPFCYRKDYDYIYFTNNKNIKNDGFWEIVYLDNPENLDATRLNRKIKLLGHEALKDYDYSVYIDSNIDILSPKLFNLVDDLIKNNAKIAITDHFMRDCIYDEAKEVIRFNKDDKESVEAQINIFKDDNYPKHNGLKENNIIFRQHNDSDIKDLMLQWWYWVKNYSKRDQLSLNYVLWKNNITIPNIFEYPVRIYNKDLNFLNHLR